MARDEVLSADEVVARVAGHPQWEVVDGALHRELVFADFDEAFAFMTTVAAAARELDHHPDWSNSWNKVVLDVASHAAGGITERCFDLVDEIDKALGE